MYYFKINKFKNKLIRNKPISSSIIKNEKEKGKLLNII